MNAHDFVMIAALLLSMVFVFFSISYDRKIRAINDALLELEKRKCQPDAVAAVKPDGVWPCRTCGAKDWEDSGNRCISDNVCSADDQRIIDYQKSNR